jgi:hypothetical protein
VLLGDEEGVAPDHQVPAHRGMARDVRDAIADRQALEGLLPASMDLAEPLNRAAIAVEEEVVMAEASSRISFCRRANWRCGSFRPMRMLFNARAGLWNSG